MANNYDLYLNGVVVSGTKADFTNKKLVLPSTLTPVSVSNNGVLNIDCDNASNGLFSIDCDNPISSITANTTINSLKISNPVIGGQYVVYITNTSQFELSIMGRANLTVTVNNGITNFGKLNYPVTILVKGGTGYSSNAILSFTYDGSYVYVACTQYGS